jgi:hydroxymethylpyrimidine pyrophosphatase-like HAD family hydrolase
VGDSGGWEPFAAAAIRSLAARLLIFATLEAGGEAPDMYCRAFACDYDGTGAVAGRLAPEAAAALAAARAEGYATLLVTGRVLEDLRESGMDFGGFDAVVAENGALVWLPASDRTIRLGEPPPDRFLAELRARNVAFRCGAVVVGIAASQATTVLEAIRALGVDAQIAFNRGEAMVLPSAVNKAAGTLRALEEVGRSAHNMIAFGDAENDASLLASAELGIAPRGAVPSISARADERLSLPGPAGVGHRIGEIVAAGGVVPTPSRHRLVLGWDADGGPAALPAAGTNLMISGDPRSGKSWLAGLVLERLLEREYSVCVIDPEGDYGEFDPRPRLMVLGRHLPLPAANVVASIVRDEPGSFVLDLAALPHGEKLAYVSTVLCGLEALRARTGLPHWTVIDEAHYFFHASSPCRLALESRTGHYVFVTYRPSLVADAVHAAVGAHLVTHTTVEDERYFIAGLLRGRGPDDLLAPDALAELEPPRAGLLLEGPAGPRWQVFTPAERAIAHVHHRRKYADLPLPEAKAFRFLGAGNAPATVAHNVHEFRDAIRFVPERSLQHHMIEGDFSRWAHDVLGDTELATGLRKLELTTRSGAAPSRDEIIEHIADRYAI